MKNILRNIAFVVFMTMIPSLMGVGSSTCHAQIPRIAYLSYDAALKSMPDYAVATASVDSLKAQFDRELQSAEREFSQKYELFLEQMQNMVPAIRDKRQSELQLMMERNMAFREESKRLLQQARTEAMEPLYSKLNAMLSQLGNENGYAVILNTDNNAVPFIHPELAEDINELVQAKLK